MTYKKAILGISVFFILIVLASTVSAIEPLSTSIHYYRFESNLEDYSAVSTNTTLTGAPASYGDSLVSGGTKSGVYSNHISTNITLPNSASIKTIEFWFNRTGDGGNADDVIFSLYDDADDRDYFWLTNTFKPYWFSARGGTGHHITPSNITFDVGNKYHIAMVHTGARRILYINGTAWDSYPDGYDPINLMDLLEIGKATTYGGEFVGQIDNFMISNYIYTQQNITDAYNGGAGQDYTGAAGGSSSKTITHTYNTTVYENETENYFILLKNYNLTSNSNATLIYNNTEYSGTVTVTNSSYVEFNTSLEIDRYYNNASTESFQWNFTLNYVNGTISSVLNASPQTQTINWNVTVYPRVNISADDIVASAEIGSFSANDSTKTLNTTSKYLYFWRIGEGNSTIGFINSSYQYVNATIPFVAGEFSNYTFDIYTSNSFNFTFRDEINDSIIDWLLITVEFIGDTFSYNYTTTNGELYADLIYPENYLIRYYANETYAPNHYQLTLNNKSHNNVTLYLTNETAVVSATVYDAVTLTTIEGATVYLKKWYQTANAFKLVSVAQTDPAGKAYFYVEDETEFYKFTVDYPFGTTRLNTEKFYINSGNINLYINLQDDAGEDILKSDNITYSINWNKASRTFTLNWNDIVPVASNYCFYIKEYGIYARATTNSTCVTTQSGSIELAVPAENGTYYAVFEASIGGQPKLIGAAWIDLVGDKLGAGKFGVFMSAILIMVFTLMGAIHILALFFMIAGLLLAKLLGLLAISWGYVIIIMVASIILGIVIQIKKN